MGYRLLVDENFSPETADRLRDLGHEAVASVDVDGLGREAADGAIAEYAAGVGYAVVTSDTDFLEPPLRDEVQVLFVGDDTVLGHEIAARIDRLSELVDQEDLPPVYHLSESNIP